MQLRCGVEAATITVNTFTDEPNSDGDCSLRETIQLVNSDTAADARMAGTDSDQPVNRIESMHAG